MTDLTACGELKRCPFCGGHAHWCMCDEGSGCHRIECDGCSFQLDTLEELNDFDTVEQIREVMARRWDTRADQGGEAVAWVQPEELDRLKETGEEFVYSEQLHDNFVPLYTNPPRATAVEDARDDGNE